MEQNVTLAGENSEFNLLHADWQYSRKGREKDSGEYLDELNKGFKPMQVGEKKEELEGRYFCCQV